MEAPTDFDICVLRNNKLLQILTEANLFVGNLEELEARQLQTLQGRDAELDAMVAELKSLNAACRGVLHAMVHETLQIRDERKKKEGELSVEVQVQCTSLLEEALAAFTTTAMKLQVAVGVANGLTAAAYAQHRLQERKAELRVLLRRRESLVAIHTQIEKQTKKN